MGRTAGWRRRARTNSARTVVPLAAVVTALVWGASAQAATPVSGTLPAGNTYWTPAGSPYLLNGNVSVPVGATLWIQPGVVVKFNGQGRMLTVNGTIQATGVGGNPVVFTSIQDDTVGGDSNGDGAATQPAPGQWYSMIVNSTGSELRYVDVRYGGYGSASWGYAAIGVNGSLLVADSYVHHNQQSGLKVGSGGALTVQRSTIAKNANGISANMGSITMENSTVVGNSNDGLWFNLLSSYTGIASTVMDSEIRKNGGDGIEIGIDRALALAKWPHGNRNNIFENATNKQINLGGYHPVPPHFYDVDWKNNFWGDDVYYWYAPALCLGTAPNSPGHLGYLWSHPPPGAGGLPQAPDGPLPWRPYIGGSGNNVAYCAYDRFQIGPNDFSRTRFLTAGRLPLGETQTRFAPELHYDSSENYWAGSAAMITDNYTETYANMLWSTAFGYLAASDPSYPSDTLYLDYLGDTYLSSYPNSQATSSTDFIDEVDNYEEDAQRLQAAYGHRAYGRYHPLDDGGVILQYWFFYYYNGSRPLGIGNHEGDWEMIQLRLDPGGSPVKASYSQHTGAETCDWVHVPRTFDLRPIVYVGEGSHANFFSPGRHTWDAGAVVDEANGEGEVVTPWVLDVTVVEPRWLEWPGRWGASMGGSGGQQPSPDGPAMKGDKWGQPDVWEGTTLGCTEGQTFPYRPRGARTDTPPAHRPAVGGSPPLPQIEARRVGKQVVVEYHFDALPTGRSLRPAALVTTVDPAGDRYAPLTYRTRIRGRDGRFTRPLGLGKGPFTLRVAVMAPNGARGRTISMRLRS
jgi:hypothetical protein